MNNGNRESRSDIGPTAPLLLTAEGAAEALAVPEATVRNLHREKKLRGIFVGRHLRFSPATLSAFIEKLDTQANGK